MGFAGTAESLMVGLTIVAVLATTAGCSFILVATTAGTGAGAGAGAGEATFCRDLLCAGTGEGTGEDFPVDALNAAMRAATEFTGASLVRSVGTAAGAGGGALFCRGSAVDGPHLGLEADILAGKSPLTGVVVGLLADNVPGVDGAEGFSRGDAFGEDTGCTRGAVTSVTGTEAKVVVTFGTFTPEAALGET